MRTILCETTKLIDFQITVVHIFPNICFEMHHFSVPFLYANIYHNLDGNSAWVKIPYPKKFLLFSEDALERQSEAHF